MKTAIIVGCEGQDGRIAYDAMGAKGYRVIGLGRGSVKSSGMAWNEPADIRDKEQVAKLVQSLQADEIYYLAAYHQSSEDRLKDNAHLLQESYEVNVLGALHFLEAIKEYSPNTKLFYASSSLIYEGTMTLVQDENTPFSPQGIYGMTKLDGLLLCRYYRASYGVFASSGILYNHESFYRRENFISKKIVKAAINIKQGKQEVLTVGDLNAETDWGYAVDYVEAMQRILNSPQADDFIIATGETHSVRQFAQEAFALLGLDWKKYVREDPSLMTRKRKNLVGNPKKLKEMTGWKPTVSFQEMIKVLVKAQEEEALRS